jgi:hypothetical protein
MSGSAKNLWSDEDGMTPEERLEAVVELLTRAVLRMVELECEEMARGIVKVRTAADRGAGPAASPSLTSGRTNGLMGH